MKAAVQRGLGAVLVAAALPGAWLAPAAFFAAWLAACVLAIGLVLGALSWLWIHRLTGGAWGDALRPHASRLAARLPLCLLLCLPLPFGATRLYPWLDPARAAAPAAEAAAFLHAWQTPAFFAARLAAYAVVWLGLAWRAQRPFTRGAAAASLALHMVVTSLAAVDTLVALVPGWSSSVYGWLTLTGQLLGGGALAVALACAQLQRSGVSVPQREGVPVTRDLGNLLLAAMLTWAYLSFMQLLVIWAENLPREIAWYVPRLQTRWLAVGVALVVLHLAVPLGLLLFRAVKDAPQRLAAVALLLLAAHALDVAWNVVPSVAPHAAASAWLLPLLMAGIGLLAFGGLDTVGASDASAATAAPPQPPPSALVPISPRSPPGAADAPA